MCWNPFPSEAEEIWVQYYFKYSDNWTVGTGSKLIFVLVGGGGNVFTSFTGGSKRFYFTTQTYATNSYPPNQGPEPTMVNGQWYKHVLHLKMNTAGVLDGVIEMWVNDVLTTRYTNVGYRPSSQAGRGFFDITINTGKANVAAGTGEYVLYDHTIVQTTPFGDSGGPDTNPPYISNVSPANGTSIQESSRTITANITDVSGSVTRSSVTLGVKVNNGSTTTYSYGSGLTFSPNVATSSSYTITRVQGSDWTAGDNVSIYLNGADDVGNVMPQQVTSFTVASGWTLQWSSEFDNVSCTTVSPCAPDMDTWYYCMTEDAPDATNYAYGNTGCAGGQGEVEYSLSDRLDTVRVADGNLIITARNENIGGHGITSGALKSGVDDGIYKKIFGPYGKMEFRAKLPQCNGSWPSLWGIAQKAVEDNVAYIWGEMDTVEAWGRRTNSVQVGLVQHDPFVILGPAVVSGIDFTQYHTFAHEWFADRIDFYVDGVLAQRKSLVGVEGFSYPFDLRVALEVINDGGAGVSTSCMPYSMYVDYIRWYTLGTPSPALSIATVSPLSTGTVGTSYPASSITAIGGSAPHTFSVISGTYPPGMAFSGSGVLSGVPTVDGTYIFTIMVTDSLSVTATKQFSLTINPYSPGIFTTVTGVSGTDTFINSGSAGTNYGTSTTMTAYQWPAATVANRIIYKNATDMTALPDSVLVTDAKLRLYLDGYEGGGGTNPMRLHARSISGTLPDPATVTWTSFAGTLSSDLSVAEVTLVDGWWEWDVTSYVAAQYAASKAAVYIALDGSSDGAVDTNRSFAAVDYPTSSLRPQLVITYRLMSGGLPVAAPGTMRVTQGKFKSFGSSN
jgi:beta-glucanase (GH16 family)